MTMTPAPAPGRRAYPALADAALAELASAGDREAFRAIMQRSNQRLFRVARAIVRDDAEAEDVVQEAYARAFSHLAGFRAESGLLTWLTRITINEARGRLRRRRPVVGLDQLDRLQPAQARIIMFPTVDNPEADAARGQIRRLLEEAVDELPEAFRLVFLLREVEECSTEATAAQLGLRVETVKTRLHRARRLLRKALDEKLASSMTGAFPFLGARCERMTEAVLERLAPVYGWA
jgi:RNA polymerase sigma-70 factor (ECF subfamily)